MSTWKLGNFTVMDTTSSSHGKPTWPPTTTRSGRSSITCSRWGMSRPVSDGRNGPVCPIWVHKGTPASMQVM
ncbi:MAG: hypothetical protein R2749_31580 [Acidimicrobiales bacterium]